MTGPIDSMRFMSFVLVGLLRIVYNSINRLWLSTSSNLGLLRNILLNYNCGSDETDYESILTADGVTKNTGHGCCRRGRSDGGHHGSSLLTVVAQCLKLSNKQRDCFRDIILNVGVKCLFNLYCLCETSCWNPGYSVVLLRWSLRMAPLTVFRRDQLNRGPAS